jgi:hypothetical protein
MKGIIRHLKERLEAFEPGMTVVETTRRETENCQIAEALWQEYRLRNPEGLTSRPLTTEDCEGDPSLVEYCNHLRGCDQCNNL